MKNIIKPLAKSVLIPLGLTVAASAADAEIHKKVLGSGKHCLDLALPKQYKTTTLIISNDEMEHITKIFKSLEDFVLLLRGISETIQNEAKEQKGGFFSMLLGTLGASLSGNILAGKGTNKVGCKSKKSNKGNKQRKQRSYKSRLWIQGIFDQIGFLIPLHSLTNFEMQKCC